MFQDKKIGALLLLGGEGRRFGSPIPKQFHLLEEKMLFCHALEALQKGGLFDEILLVCHAQWMDRCKEWGKCVAGGATRQESSYRGALALKGVDIALIHDGVRPFVSERVLRENVEGAIRWGAVNTCIPSTDTLVYAPSRTILHSIPKREEYLRGQTPQTFRRDWILEAHEQALKDGVENASDDCSLVLRMGRPVHVVPGEERNLKVTSEFDLWMARHWCKNFSLT